MAVCRYMGPPDFFVTIICNPNWPKIQSELQRISGQRPEDRSDILVRVFHLKLKQFLKDIKCKKIFENFIADTHVIEFQKRGLPHSHIVLTVAADAKCISLEDIDEVICAEIPDLINEPFAYESVTRYMIHGPCGILNPSAPCMIDGKCSKGYAKKFQESTTIDADGFVLYRRRDDGIKAMVNDIEVDNCWVVPYNIDLTTRYDTHINVEKCARSKVLKYLFKYLHKGTDQLTIFIQDNSIPRDDVSDARYGIADEIKQYLDCRYISAIEACWSQFSFSLRQQIPPVERLQYHLPNQQMVVFNETENIHYVLSRTGIDRTMSTQWFQANQQHSDARCLTYAELPKF